MHQHASAYACGQLHMLAMSMHISRECSTHARVGLPCLSWRHLSQQMLNAFLLTRRVYVHVCAGGQVGPCFRCPPNTVTIKAGATECGKPGEPYLFWGQLEQWESGSADVSCTALNQINVTPVAMRRMPAIH
jgi:hypothetical protein